MKKLLVDGFTTKIACPTRSFRVLVYASGVDVSTSTLRYLSACLRTRRRAANGIRDDIHEAFLRFACAIICWRCLRNISNC